MNNFNLLDINENESKKEFKKWYKITIVSTFIIVACITTFQVIQMKNLFSLKKQIIHAQNEQSTKLEYNEISSDQNNIFRVMQKIKKWENPKNDPYYTLNDISQAITPNTALQEIDYEKNVVILSGISKSLNDFQKFLENISSLSWANSVKISKLQPQTGNIHMFEIKIEFTNDKQT
ncbi:PilN domain-containing protein [Candidatus Dependentiae bacterium]|nr:PilN domain-containing protein [Candidatus Dependentiae bacterium]